MCFMCVLSSCCCVFTCYVFEKTVGITINKKNMSKIKVLSLNMRGGRNPKKRLTIFEILKNNANFILLQECHILKDDLTQWKKDWNMGDVFINPYSNRSGGQAILLKQKQSIDDHKVFFRRAHTYLKSDNS